MDVKDQRLEIRIPQQQLDELDAIRNSASSTYTLTRSDMARMYIAQGIECHKQGQEETSNVHWELSRGERLNIFFQTEQFRIQTKGRRTSYNKKDPKQVEIEDLDLVNQVYSERFFWFFELDSEGLGLLNGRLQNRTLHSLIDSKFNKQVKENLKRVCEVVRMFTAIEDCMKYAYDDDRHIDTIKKYSQRNGVPLEFPGFPVSALQLNEMAGLVKWIDADDARWGIITRACDQDFTMVFDQMLVVYRELTKGRRQFNTEILEEMILAIRLGL